MGTFTRFLPSPDFLSDIAAIEAVIIAIAIPLSFEIVSRISERYKSEIIAKRFDMYWANRFLPAVLVLNIILAISLKFSFHESLILNLDGYGARLWTIFAYSSYVFFLLALILFVAFIDRLRTIMINPDKLLHELFKEAENFFK